MNSSNSISRRGAEKAEDKEEEGVIVIEEIGMYLVGSFYYSYLLYRDIRMRMIRNR
jgi:hypothetical protein